MKKQFISFRTFLLLGLIVSITSCTKNLNQTAKSTATESAVFNSASGLQLYSNSFYNLLPSITAPFRTDCQLSDLGATTSVPDYIRKGAYTSQTTSGWTWTGLRNINYFIVNCENSSVTESVKENYLGIARFFRAYFYFNMMQRYGNVPWYNTPLNTADTSLLFKARDSRTLIMDSIIADLDYAGQHISTTSDATRSSITKWVVYGYKSRFCLWEGTFRKYQTSYNLQSTANNLLQLAANAADSVMQSGVYSLNTTGGNLAYRNLFISTSPVTSEVMLADVTSSSLSITNDANWYFTSSTYGDRFNFTRKFINTYLNLDGTPFTDKPGHDTMVFYTETQNRDLRLQQTIRTPGYKRTTNGTGSYAPPVFSYSYTGYQPIKWCLDDTYYDAGALNTNSIPLMRYAEILLNYAEARAELGTLTNSDWAQTIGTLRSRAGITGGLTILPSKIDTFLQNNYYPDITNPVILEIRRERSIELTLEGFRFYDLVRWNHGELLAKSWNGMYVPALNIPMDLDGNGTPDVCFYTSLPANQVSGVTYINVSAQPQVLSQGTFGEIHWLDNIAKDWESYKYLYPIPYTELQLNTRLTQNPGW